MDNRTYYIRSYYYSHIISTHLTVQLVATGNKNKQEEMIKNDEKASTN